MSLKIGAAKVYRRNILGFKLMKMSVNRVRVRNLTLQHALNYFCKDVAFSHSSLKYNLNASS